MTEITQADVRAFMTAHLTSAAQRPLDPSELSDDADLLTSGLIDSLGVLELVTAMEQHFQVEIDFDDLDPADFGRVSMLTQYVAERATPDQEA